MRGTYLGLFFTSLASLMLEILLTRVFSVSTWYYYAFFAISVTMFGLTVGALMVYLWKRHFPQELLYERLTLFALLFGVAVDVALFVFLSVPFNPRLSGVGIFATTFVYLAISLPFVCAGVIVCLCLTRFPEKVGLLYAADLVGAGLGAFMVFPVLNAMDAPTAIFLVGAVGALSGLFFARNIEEKGKRRALIGGTRAAFIALTVLMLVNFFFRPVKVEWVTGIFRVPQFELWNSFSRIAVYPLKFTKAPYSWGLSKAYKQDHPIGERMIDIDGVSGTVMTLFEGDLEEVRHLKYDVTHIAHYLKSDASVFVIGVGGGRDILAAKLFNQKSVTGAEINNRIIEMLTDVFGDFTGHLDRLPGVTIINDEARSAITRMDEKFDIIQASCIATWSATTAGAFTLAENSLYTYEAWKTFFDHLTPEGVLSFNRWYSPDYPAQLLRLTSLAAYTLKREGVEDPSRHIAVVRNDSIAGLMPSATILVSKSPFSAESLAKLRKAVEELKFRFVYDPDGFKEPLFKGVVDNVNNPEFHDRTPLDIKPLNDDRPFFFYMLRLRDAFSGGSLVYKEQGFIFRGIVSLFILLIVSVVLCAVFIIAPLIWMSLKRKREGEWGRAEHGNLKMPLKAWIPALFFFGSIGFGYILVEVAMLQRLIIFLGHPIYSITVVIFAMLLSSGIGSIFSNSFTGDGRLGKGHIALFFLIILALLLVVIYMQPSILPFFEKNGIYARIAVALIFLVPLGFFMGIPFPFGMSIGSVFKEHTPWFWAINGATSVVSSVMSVAVSITWGFTMTLTVGFAFYVLALLSLLFFYSAGKEYAREHREE